MAERVDVGRGWQAYARALIDAMREVLEEADDRHRELMLEVADFWFGLGLAAGLERPSEATQLLSVIESDAQERDELLRDADSLLAQVVS